MHPDAATIVVNGAPSQHDRWRPALDPGHARADDRSLPELLDFAVRFGRLINYYGPDNTVEGDWSALFTSDPVLALASMATVDAVSMDRAIAVLVRGVRAEQTDRKRDLFDAVFEALLELPRQMDGWLRATRAEGAGATVRFVHDRLAADARDHLGPHLRRLVAYDRGWHRVSGRVVHRPRDYSAFGPEWRIPTVTADDSIFSGTSDLEKIDRALPAIVAAWQPFPDAARRWAGDAPRRIITAMHQGGQHPPHTALFIAFVRLLTIAQKSVNGFSRRRADFYLRTVLREVNQPPVPDSVYVAFEAARGATPAAVTIPRGTLLAAGKGTDGRDVLYASHDDLTVTGAALETIRTVRVVSGRLIPHEPDEVVQRVVAREMTRLEANASGWATFGSAGDPAANIGFSVASPVLALSGGERTVTVRVRHPRPHPAADRALTRLSQATGLGTNVVLTTLLESAFAISVSTAAGWLPVDTYTVGLGAGPDDAGFVLRWVLGPAVAPMARWPDSPLAAASPAVRVSLRQQAVTLGGPLGLVSAFPLSVLAGMVVARADVEVQVSGLAPTRVENPDGVVDGTKPFPAFGMAPRVGSYLRAGHPELIPTFVNRLTLRITWYDLPVNPTGFEGYYRGYVVGPSGFRQAGLFDNQVFRASVTLEGRGASAMVPRTGDAGQCLYRSVGGSRDTPEAGDLLLDQTTFEIPVTGAGREPNGHDGPPGVVRVELTAPPYAFGDDLYAQNLRHAALADVPSEPACRAACRAEYQPFADVVRRLERLEDASRVGLWARGAELLSPVRPLARLWDALETAVFALTRWLLMLGSRRRETPSRSAWIIRVVRSDTQVESGRRLRGAYRHLVTATVESSLGTLLDAARASLSSCLLDWSDLFPPSHRSTLLQQLSDSRRGSPIEQLAALTHLRSLVQKAAEVVGPDLASEHLQPCDRALQAASWVRDCDAGSALDRESTYRRAVRALVIACLGRIKTMHAGEPRGAAPVGWLSGMASALRERVFGGRAHEDPAAWLEEAVTVCTKECLGRKKATPRPNAPHLPQVAALSLDYLASGPAAVAHLLPFGGYRPLDATGPEPQALLPGFAHAGNLYLGFSQLPGSHALPLYIRLAHGQGAPSPDVAWAHVSADRWLPLQTPASVDGTRGFRRSGIITLPIPATVADGGTALPGQMQWLRAAVLDRADDVPRMVSIHAHAVLATRQEDGSRSDDSTRALPPHTIVGLLRPVKGIAAVTQPSASFGGRGPESDRALRVRVSERLRHKDRAILPWDYEHLVLERFPTVWKARALPARPRRLGERSPVGPGCVRVIVVPGPTSLDVTDVTAPTSSAELLGEIASMLQTSAGPSVRVQVANPAYVRIRVTAAVTWKDGVDGRASAERLNRELVAHLSPWRIDAGDQRFSEPAISEFVQSRPYIDAVSSVALQYDPADSLAVDPDSCFLTTALTHEIRDAAAVVAVHEGRD